MTEQSNPTNTEEQKQFVFTEDYYGEYSEIPVLKGCTLKYNAEERKWMSYNADGTLRHVNFYKYEALPFYCLKEVKAQSQSVNTEEQLKRSGDKVLCKTNAVYHGLAAQSDSEQLKSLEKEAEEKVKSMPDLPYNDEYTWCQGYIAGAQRTEQLLKHKDAQIEVLDKTYFLQAEQIQQLQSEKQKAEINFESYRELSDKNKELQQENAQLKEELKHEELKMEAIQGHVDALWEENAQLKGKVIGEKETWPLIDVLTRLTTAAEILLNKKDYDGHDYEEIGHCVERGKRIAEYLKSITDKTENA